MRLFYREYEKMKAMNRPMSELDKARIDADKNGWLDGKEVLKRLEEKYNL